MSSPQPSAHTPGAEPTPRRATPPCGPPRAGGSPLSDDDRAREIMLAARGVRLLDDAERAGRETLHEIAVQLVRLRAGTPIPPGLTDQLRAANAVLDDLVARRRELIERINNLAMNVSDRVH